MIAEHGRQRLRRRLEKAWAVIHFQDASVDLRNRDNEFHGADYIDYYTGPLEHAFTGVVQKPSRGTKGQIEAFVQCISNLYPKSRLVKPDQPVTEEIELMNRRVSRKLSDELNKQMENDESTEEELTQVRENRKHGESVYHEPDLIPEDTYIPYLSNPKHRPTPSNSHTQSGTERSRELDTRDLMQNPSSRSNPSSNSFESAAASSRAMEALSSNGTQQSGSQTMQQAGTSSNWNNQSPNMKSFGSSESEGNSDSEDSDSAALKAISPFLISESTGTNPSTSQRESTYQDSTQPDCTSPSIFLGPAQTSVSRSERRGSIIHPNSLNAFAQKRRHSLIQKDRRNESIRRQSLRQKHKRETRSELAQAMAAARISENHATNDKERRASFLGLVGLPGLNFSFGNKKRRDSASPPSSLRSYDYDNETADVSTGLNLRDAALSIKLARAGSSTPRNDEAATKDFILSEHLFPTKNVARRRHTIGINQSNKSKPKKQKPKFAKTLSRNRESLDCSEEDLERMQSNLWLMENHSDSELVSEDSDRSYSGLEIFHEAKGLTSKELWEIIARSRYVIDRMDVEIDDQEQLGGGRFGKVYQADYNGATVAMKRVNIDNQEGFIKECDLFFEVSTHPNICRYFGFAEINNVFYIVMEFFQNGSILHTMQTGTRFTMDQKVNICRQISAGILHLHRKGVIHGDIAARNVLCDVRQMRVAVTDFGFSRKVGDTTKSRYISTRWAAPELTHEFIFTLSSDVYALGVTCMEVLQDGKNPFSGMSNTEVKRKVSSGMTPKIPESLHPNIQQILLGSFHHRSERLEVKHIYDGWKHYEQHFLTTGFE